MQSAGLEPHPAATYLEPRNHPVPFFCTSSSMRSPMASSASSAFVTTSSSSKTVSCDSAPSSPSCVVPSSLLRLDPPIQAESRTSHAAGTEAVEPAEPAAEPDDRVAIRERMRPRRADERCDETKEDSNGAEESALEGSGAKSDWRSCKRYGNLRVRKCRN